MQANNNSAMNNYNQTTPNWPGNTEEKVHESSSPNFDKGGRTLSPDKAIERFDAASQSIWPYNDGGELTAEANRNLQER